MSLVKELRDLLFKKTRSETATVVTCTPKAVTLAIRSGQRTLPNNGSLYVEGDVLVVRDSTVLGRAPREENLPQYFI